MFGVFSGYEKQLLHDWIAGDWQAPQQQRAIRRVPSDDAFADDAWANDTELKALQDALHDQSPRQQLQLLIPWLSARRHCRPAGLYATRRFIECVARLLIPGVSCTVRTTDCPIVLCWSSASAAAAQDYRFITPTPLTHERCAPTRAPPLATDRRDVFGWSMPFEHTLFPAQELADLEQAAIVEKEGSLWRARYVGQPWVLFDCPLGVPDDAERCGVFRARQLPLRAIDRSASAAAPSPYGAQWTLVAEAASERWSSPAPARTPTCWRWISIHGRCACRR